MTIDRETGEVVSERTVTYDVMPASDEPDYVKLYVRAWVVFKGMHGINPTDSDVLAALLQYMSYAQNGQIVYTSAAMKRVITEQLHCSMGAVNNALTRLAKHGVLKRVDRGAYQVNPELVGKGPWADIKRLRATFSVIGPDAGTVSVEAAY